jgi:nitrate/nitrite transporter NarK
MIGWISDRTGSLRIAFTAAFIAATLSAVFFLYGARFAPRLHARSVPQEA